MGDQKKEPPEDESVARPIRNLRAFPDETGGAPLHPLFGALKGTVKIAPGVDLTEPACPEWADIAEEKADRFGTGDP